MVLFEYAYTIPTIWQNKYSCGIYCTRYIYIPVFMSGPCSKILLG